MGRIGEDACYHWAMRINRANDSIAYVWMNGDVRYMRRERKTAGPWRERWLGTKEVAQLLDVHQHTARRIVMQVPGATNVSATPGSPHSGHWRVRAGDLARWMQTQRPAMAAKVGMSDEGDE